jgi:hypothetical protein
VIAQPCQCRQGNTASPPTQAQPCPLSRGDTSPRSLITRHLDIHSHLLVCSLSTVLPSSAAAPPAAAPPSSRSARCSRSTLPVPLASATAVAALRCTALHWPRSRLDVRLCNAVLCAARSILKRLQLSATRAPVLPCQLGSTRLEPRHPTLFTAAPPLPWTRPSGVCPALPCPVCNVS